ncbi:hypothetical protein WR25_14603 isoform L [Diploscapter pachys]|nr:hypothetical protein WR25_14603 isoform B [Diploscapter pachys]PAV90456.1 hypothetical protein WR25_14603 isoform C [Diploscapter pachys]PAV90458.1 hypothetical protein WR25_14603 isoform E [Diploscapter pachys]PAV90462.1 hypothetical protein WR25_14603 isoform I [Diploscapter pachys]PAV90463.1 hypothetical protein WR25_14603 isoform J [Diploscapter pachys]
MSSGKYPQIGYNPYEPFLDLYSSEKMIHPIDNIPEPKSRFVPSKQEMEKVSKLVHAIKMGWLKPPQKKEEPKPYDLWASEDSSSSLTKSQIARMRVHMPAPKMPLPIHNESYNPPEEYLLDEEEKKKWKEAEPEDRPANYIPEKFDSYRRVPQYKEFLSERYDRCLDLYLAPRKIKNKLQVADPSQLLPDLPNPNDLKPFPTTLAFYMHGHSGQVRSISMEPEKGELMASGGADGTVKIWMIDMGRCVKTFKVEGPVTSVAFCPNAELTLLAVSYEGHQIALLNTGCGDRLLVANTEKFLKELPIGEVESQIDWRRNRERVILKMPNEVRKVVWHQKGDYFASVAIADIASSVYIHQLSKAKSQCPFRKRKGHVQTVGFHPVKPHLFVATKVSIRYYDLARCILLKKCSPGTAHVGAIAYDHTGDNLFVGGLDRKFSWLDLQLSNKPWKKFRHHRSAIRGVVFHKRYPLLATVSDDGSAMIYYVRIYTDSSRDNEIYPVKRLYPHQAADDLSVLDVAWHPTQPWLLTAGANGTVALFSSHYAHSSKSPSERCYYEVLGVPKNATTVQIKTAFYAKSKQLHPDNTGDSSAAAFVELKKAYDTLRRPADRRLYDLRGSMPPPRDTSKYQHPYSHFYNQNTHENYRGDWKRYWHEEPGWTFYEEKMNASEIKKKSENMWKSILKWTIFGSILVIAYNAGYFLQLKHNEKMLAKLIDEDEIAKCFLRQKEFKDKEVDNVELRNLAQMLKADVDDAWKRKMETLEGRNRDEIREEARWFKAVHEDPSHRRIAEQRAQRRKEIAEWEKQKREMKAAEEAFIFDESEADEQSKKFCQRIRTQTSPECSFTLCQQRKFQLDVSCLQSIAQFGEEMAREQRTIDILVQNAGIMGLPFELSSDNVEMHFATHCFGPSLLVRHLLECFERSNDPRIIMVSSGYYKKVNCSPPTMLQLMGERDFEYNEQFAYSYSKLAMCQLTKELNRRLSHNKSKILVVSMRPGFVRGTQLGRATHWLLRALAAPFIFIFGQSLDKGIETMHYLMTTERENLKGGSMYYGCQEEEYTDMVSSRWCRELWETLETMTTTIIKRANYMTEEEKKLCWEKQQVSCLAEPPSDETAGEDEIEQNGASDSCENRAHKM